MSARKSSHRTIFLIVSNGSPLALIASSLRSTSKKPVCPMTRSLDPPMAHCGQRVRFVATWREEFFEVPYRYYWCTRSSSGMSRFIMRGGALPFELFPGHQFPSCGETDTCAKYTTCREQTRYEGPSAH